jgi:hypothetical protein
LTVKLKDINLCNAAAEERMTTGGILSIYDLPINRLSSEDSADTSKFKVTGTGQFKKIEPVLHGSLKPAFSRILAEFGLDISS